MRPRWHSLCTEDVAEDDLGDERAGRALKRHSQSHGRGRGRVNWAGEGDSPEPN